VAEGGQKGLGKVAREDGIDVYICINIFRSIDEKYYIDFYDYV